MEFFVPLRSDAISSENTLADTLDRIRQATLTLTLHKMPVKFFPS